MEEAQRARLYLIHILGTEARMSIKARALAILLAFDSDRLPFIWNKDVRGTGDISDQFKNLPIELQLFAAQCVCESIDLWTRIQEQARPSLHDRPDVYNEAIWRLLSLLPETEPVAAELSKRYTIARPVLDGSQPLDYGPILTLFTKDGVPERWKQEADARFRVQLSTLSDHTNKWIFHQRLGAYWNLINQTLDRLHPCCTEELLISQIAFALSLMGEHPHGFSFMHGFYDRKIIDLLKKGGHDALQQRYVRDILEMERFKVTREEDLPWTEALRETFAREPNFVHQINLAISQYHVRHQQQIEERQRNADRDAREKQAFALLC